MVADINAVGAADMAEELGEISACVTKGKPTPELAEEVAMGGVDLYAVETGGLRPGRALAAGIAGLLFGLPSLKIKGFYLIMATIAAQDRKSVV